MFDAVKRWFTGGGADWRGLAAWARRRGAQFKRSSDGFVVDGALAGRPWRLEWGVPQRSYLSGRELRLRMELGLTQTLQMLLLSRSLLETLERQTFDKYTANMQTHIDVTTPAEMRWLALFPKVKLGPALKRRFGAVAASPVAAAAWLSGDLEACLSDAALGPLSADPPLLLMTLRGRVYLRLEIADPEPVLLDTIVDLFEKAAAQAVRVNAAAPFDEESDHAATAWQTLNPPDDAPE